MFEIFLFYYYFLNKNHTLIHSFFVVVCLIWKRGARFFAWLKINFDRPSTGIS